MPLAITDDLLRCDWLGGLKKVKVAYTKHRFPELIPVLGSQPAGEVSHKPAITTTRALQ